MVLAGRQGFGWAAFVLYGERETRRDISGTASQSVCQRAQSSAAERDGAGRCCSCELGAVWMQVQPRQLQDKGFVLGTVFFFPENNLTRVKMKGLEPLNEKGQEAGRMSEEVPSEFLIWEGNCFGNS